MNLLHNRFLQIYALLYIRKFPFNADLSFSHPIRTLIILVQDKNTSLKLPVDVSPLQLVLKYLNNIIKKKLVERVKMGHWSL
jgi:hypothetical protein